MSDNQKLITKKGLVFDLFLTAIFFAFFAWFLRPYVPAQSEVFTTIFAIFTASCLSALFLLVLQMFRVIFNDMRLQDRD